MDSRWPPSVFDHDAPGEDDIYLCWDDLGSFTPMPSEYSWDRIFDSSLTSDNVERSFPSWLQAHEQQALIPHPIETFPSPPEAPYPQAFTPYPIEYRATNVSPLEDGSTSLLELYSDTKGIPEWCDMGSETYSFISHAWHDYLRQAVDSSSSLKVSSESSTYFHCAMEDCCAVFTGRYAKGNLARHKRSEHSGGGYDCDDRHGSSHTHIDGQERARRYLEPPDREHDSPWSHRDKRELGRILTARLDLCSSYGTKTRVARLRNVSLSSLVAVLQRFESMSTSRSDEKHLMPLMPYGIIYMRKRSWLDPLASGLYAICQIACCLVMRNYELCRGRYSPHCGPSAASPFFLDKLWVGLNSWVLNEVSALHASVFSHSRNQTTLTSSLLGYLRSPSAFLFGCFGLFYATAVIFQYRLSRRDAYQYLSVPLGITTGVFTLVASTCLAYEDPKIASTLALCVSVAMMLSVTMHSTWRTLVSPRGTRLRYQIDKWVHDSAHESTDPEKRMHFCEIS
ncbi:hypothetical protein IG631_17145 [Alternaria alternata]|nr:hypothetical protein IG631_17145 [Alternaria alternata]